MLLILSLLDEYLDCPQACFDFWQLQIVLLLANLYKCFSAFSVFRIYDWKWSIVRLYTKTLLNLLGNNSAA